MLKVGVAILKAVLVVDLCGSLVLKCYFDGLMLTVQWTKHGREISDVPFNGKKKWRVGNLYDSNFDVMNGIRYTSFKCYFSLYA